MKVYLKNNVGVVKECKVGFSWTTFFFGLFVPLIRGDFKWSAIMLLLSMLTLGISWLVMPFIYNKKYITSLLEKGYAPASDADKDILVNKGILAAETITE